MRGSPGGAPVILPARVEDGLARNVGDGCVLGILWDALNVLWISTGFLKVLSFRLGLALGLVGVSPSGSPLGRVCFGSALQGARCNAQGAPLHVCMRGFCLHQEPDGHCATSASSPLISPRVLGHELVPHQSLSPVVEDQPIDQPHLCFTLL